MRSEFARRQQFGPAALRQNAPAGVLPTFSSRSPFRDEMHCQVRLLALPVALPLFM
jgi:hypothetical protein